MCGSSYQPITRSGPVLRFAAMAALGRTSSKPMYSTLTAAPVASWNFFVFWFQTSSSVLTNPLQRRRRNCASFSTGNIGLYVSWPKDRVAAAATVPRPHCKTVRRRRVMGSLQEDRGSSYQESCYLHEIREVPMPFLLGPSTILLVLAAAPPRDSGDIFHATLGETGARTAEVSTQELREILAARSATVFDSRPHLEYAMGHIPGAVDGAAVVARGDRTAVWIDVRAAEEFSKGSVAGARSVPRALVVAGKDSSELKKAKNDGRLPMTDHNTRIIVFGASPDDARFVTEQLAREAFHNVSFFAGTWAELQEATGSMASK